MKTNDVMLRTMTMVVSFMIFLFSIYLFFAGHFTPGGGFVGGLMTAGAIVLLLLAFGIETVKKMIPINFILLTTLGLLLSIATASSSLLMGKPFFTHAFTDVHIPIFGEIPLHTATLFDVGVYLVVVGVTMTIIQTIGEDK